jgi:hypothetical protein|nr:MAG TPA: hypothetical protein [Crassvirales sp.]
MKKQNKIYTLSSTLFGENDIIIKPEDSVIAWLDNYGFTHSYYCTPDISIQDTINIIKKEAKDFNSIKYVIVDNLDVKYKYEC